MDDRMLLGLTLDDALERLKREGVPPPAIEWTAAPRGARQVADQARNDQVGAPRVVRALSGRLTVARFPGPAQAEET